MTSEVPRINASVRVAVPKVLWGTATTGKRRELDERKCIVLCRRDLAPGVDTEGNKGKIEAR